MSNQVDEFVIKGLTTAGKSFRPSDWAERLCGVMSAFGSDGRMQYSPYVYPITAAGLKCVVVDLLLCEIEPMAYSFLVNFAKENELQVRDGRAVKREITEGSQGEEPGPSQREEPETSREISPADTRTA